MSEKKQTKINPVSSRTFGTCNAYLVLKGKRNSKGKQRSSKYNQANRLLKLLNQLCNRRRIYKKDTEIGIVRNSLGRRAQSARGIHGKLRFSLPLLLFAALNYLSTPDARCRAG